MNASPLKVESVFVGEAGVCARFSSKKVSPVMLRVGAISAGWKQRHENNQEQDERTPDNTSVGHTLRSRQLRSRIRCGLTSGKVWLLYALVPVPRQREMKCRRIRSPGAECQCAPLALHVEDHWLQKAPLQLHWESTASSSCCILWLRLPHHHEHRRLTGASDPFRAPQLRACRADQ